MKCEDGRIMCQLCFGGFTRDELADDEEPGYKIDVCKPCKAYEDIQIAALERGSSEDHH